MNLLHLDVMKFAVQLQLKMIAVFVVEMDLAVLHWVFHAILQLMFVCL